jgi:uncharacterized protein involved in exopolysaccharide biosynthesis
MNEEPAESLEFLRFLLRKRKPILITFSIAIVLAVIFTSMQPKRYSSSAIVFPVYNNKVESVIENPVFGYDVEADRLMQLLESDEVRDSVVDKFQLVNYYGIDKNALDWKDQLRQKYLQDVDFTRSPYMSIIIKVESEKPEQSAKIANYIISLADGVRNRIFKENELNAFHAIEKEFTAKTAVVDSLKKNIAKLRGNSESDLVALVNLQGFVQTLSGSGKSKVSTELERMLNQYIFEQSSLNDIAARYDKAKAQCESPITKIYIVDRARPSYKKVSPSYLVNFLTAGFLALFFSISVLYFLEKFREINKETRNS